MLRTNQWRTPEHDEEEFWQKKQVQVGSPQYMRAKAPFSTGPVTMHPSRKTTPASPGKKRKDTGKKPKTKKKKKVDDQFGITSKVDYPSDDEDDEESPPEPGKLSLERLME